MSVELLLPVGRMVSGSVYKGFPVLNQKTKMQELTRSGEPRVSFNIMVAILKGAEQHWNQTEWGAKVWAEGAASFPAHHARPDFFWKIYDGDQPWINDDGEAIIQPERKGCWVVRANRGWAPLVCNEKGETLTTEDAVVPGYFVQVVIGVQGNVSAQSPGIYINPEIVALMGYGEKVQTGQVDPKKFAFGGALPPGASATPVASFNPAPVAKPTPVVPNYAVLQPPAPPVVIAPPPAPPVPVGPQMTALAQASYEAYIGAGWTDEQLRANGLML